MFLEKDYSPEQFPFAAIFERLTEYVQSHTVSPLELYLMYQRERRHARLTPCPDYASTSITSGGHARIPGLNMTQIITANTRTAREMVLLMHHQGTLDSDAVVLPVDLGHVPGWRQSDYIHFWMLIIGGYTFGSGARRLQLYERTLADSLRAHVDLARMNSFDLSADERAPEYFRFADACIQAAYTAKIDREATPARKIVSLVDPHISLGGQTERYFARTTGIPVYLPKAVQPAKTVSEALTAPTLARDVDTIIRYGGTVCEVAAKPAVVFVRDDTKGRVSLGLRGGAHRISG